MEGFSELYSTYYSAVRHVLQAAAQRPLSVQDIQRILTEHAFSESAYHMLPKLQGGDWPLLKETGGGYVTSCVLPREQPLTMLQLAWLKSMLEDVRIRLFLDQEEWESLKEALQDVPSLVHPGDFHVFDQAQDGDPYSDEGYQKHFKVFLTAIHQNAPLSVQYEGGKGNRVASTFWPYKLEYSSKDDKFRALCYKQAGNRRINYVLNLGRIVSAAPNVTKKPEPIPTPDVASKIQLQEVTFEITGERNSLERCMVQFAHFEKRTEYDEATDRYTCTLNYNRMDETELVIRLLSFGPTVKVLGPRQFLDEIKGRIKRQSELTGTGKR